MALVLTVAQYRRADTPDGDEYWSLAILNPPTSGPSNPFRTQATIFQVIGYTHDYRYETKVIDILKHDGISLCGGCSIGEVEAKSRRRVASSG